MGSVYKVRVQFGPLHRWRTFVIVGVGWMSVGVVGVFNKEAGVADASDLLGFAVGTVVWAVTDAGAILDDVLFCAGGTSSCSGLHCGALAGFEPAMAGKGVGVLTTGVGIIPE